MDRERIERLRRMLRQVDPSGQAEGLREMLENVAADEIPSPLESGRAASMTSAEVQTTVESLEMLQQDSEIDEEHQLYLEAIVMPFHRPVVDIVGNVLLDSQLTPQWQHLATEQSLRSAIESTFLSIGRIEIPNHPSLPYAGSGFVVGDNLLMTNRHVAAIFASGVGERNLRFHPGQTAGIDFLQEVGQSSSEALRVDSVLMIHPYWDMALLQVSGLPAQRRALPLSTADPQILEGREVITVGYPGFDPSGDQTYQATQNRIFRGVYYVKRLQPGVLRERSGIPSFENTVSAITHDCSTLGGNSGSAVLALPASPGEPIEVIALHFAGAYLRANYAVPTHDLAQDSRVVDAGVNFAGRVEPRGDFYGPIWTKTEANQASQDPNGKSAGKLVQAPPRGAGASMLTPVPGTTTRHWTIPLHVSVSVGTPFDGGALPGGADLRITPGTPDDAAKELFGGFFSREPSFTTAEKARMFSLDSLTATGFRWSTALSLAVASELAYDNSATVVSTALNLWGLQTCTFVEMDDTQCFIASSADAVVIAFRGTESMGDWLGNLNAFSTRRSYGTVHRGFHSAMNVVKSRLEQELNRFPGRPVLMTGHSLGGALAMIAAAEWRRTYPIQSVYTYGQPGVGKADFGRFIRSNYGNAIIRFVNDDDIVPRVPPGYQHVGRLIHFDADGGLQAARESLTTEAAGIESPMMSQVEFDQLRSQLLQQNARQHSARMTESVAAAELEGLFPSFSDHKLVRYISKIRARTR